MLHTLALIPFLLCAGENPDRRVAAIEALLARLHVGTGSRIADIGAGRGQDTWTFADIAGRTGAVYPGEITAQLVKSLEENAAKRGLTQVHPILGKPDDACLPQGAIDLAYMRSVYHHFSKPHAMLRSLWRGLTPGGYLVIVDQRRGTLQDWVPRESRADKHTWTAETTVVREAREQGFEYVACMEDIWHESAPFVLVFRRPAILEAPDRDPDPPLPFDGARAAPHFLPLAGTYGAVACIALGEARARLMPAIVKSSQAAVDIVLEEWATAKDERPPVPEGIDIPSTLTEKGDPGLDDGPLDAVFFLDSYHLLFHGSTLRAKLAERLAPGGCITVLDREAAQPLPRRDASHSRRIHPDQVIEEMASAGLDLWFRGPRVAPDRFLLVFGKAPVPQEGDPYFAGPAVNGDPVAWLESNLWRLRGVITAGGAAHPLPPAAAAARPRCVSTEEDALMRVALRGTELTLVFEPAEHGFSLQSVEGEDAQVDAVLGQ